MAQRSQSSESPSTLRAVRRRRKKEIMKIKTAIPNLPLPRNDYYETFEEEQARQLEAEIQRDSLVWMKANG